MEPRVRSLLRFLLHGTRGGPNRLRILDALVANPLNAHQLAQQLGMDYRTARHHLDLLERNGVVVRPVGRAYASPYEVAPHLLSELEAVRTVPSANGRRAAADRARAELT